MKFSVFEKMLSINVLVEVVVLVGYVICGTNKLEVIVSKNCCDVTTLPCCSHPLSKYSYFLEREFFH